MTREDRDNSEPEICPECGSRLAAGNRSYDGTPVTIAVCTGYPDCTYFRWSASEDSGELRPSLFFSELADWAIKESLAILRDEFSSEEWKEALGTFTKPLGEGGEGGG